MILYILVLSVLILIIVLLINYKSRSNYYNTESETETPTDGKPCPICHWLLKPKERVHSVIYRTNSDNIMHIYGCPYCYKDHPKAKYRKDLKRMCPACNKEIPNGQFVIARLFEKPGKNHVHVLGCYRCRGKR